MKRFAGTLATILLFGALAGYYFWIEIPQEEQARKEFDQSTRLLPFEFDDILSLTYQHNNFKILAEQQTNLWKIKEPLVTEGDHMTFNGLLSQVQEVRISRVVDESPKDLATFGLKTPAFKITLDDKTVGKKTVLIGDPAPVGHSFYFKVEDDPRVLLVAGFEKDWVKTLYQFRNKSILDFETTEITSVKLVRPGNVLDLKKKADTWSISGPTQARGDSAAIVDLLNTFKHSRIQAFDEESPESLAPFGLDQPTHAVTVSTRKNSWTLSLGKRVEGKTIHAKRDDHNNVFQVEKKLIDLISTSHLDLIDKRIVTFEDNDIAQIEFRSQGETIRIKREGDEPPAWQILQPIKAKADTAVINSLLFDLKDARAREFVKFGKKENFGLSQPKGTLTLTDTNGKTKSLSLGNTNLKGDQSFLSRSLDQVVFVLDKKTVDKLFRSLHDLQDRRLLTFDESKAHWIVLKYPDTTFELKRTETGWDLIQPEPHSGLKPFIGNDILWALTKLNYEKKLSAQKGKDKPTAPTLSVTILDGQNTTLSHLEITKAQTNDQPLLAKRTHPAGLFEIQGRILDEIPETLDKFLKAKNL